MGQHRSNRSAVILTRGEKKKIFLYKCKYTREIIRSQHKLGFDVANTPTREGRSRHGRHCIWKTVGSKQWAFPRNHNTHKHARHIYSLHATSSKGPSTVPGHGDMERIVVSVGSNGWKEHPDNPTRLGSGALPMTLQQLKDKQIKAGGVLHWARKVTPEVFCPALGSSAKEGQRSAGTGSDEDHEGDQREKKIQEDLKTPSST